MGIQFGLTVALQITFPVFPIGTASWLVASMRDLTLSLLWFAGLYLASLLAFGGMTGLRRAALVRMG